MRSYTTHIKYDDTKTRGRVERENIRPKQTSDRTDQNRRKNYPPSRSRITRNSQNRGNGSQRNKNSFWEHQNRNYTHNCTVFSSSVHIYIQKRLSRCRPLHLRNENRQYHLQSQKFIVGYGDRLDSYRPERPFGDTHIL